MNNFDFSQYISMIPSFYHWIPAIVSTTALGIFGFLFKSSFKAEIERSIAYRYDIKIEELKSNLRLNEKRLSQASKNEMSNFHYYDLVHSPEWPQDNLF